MSFRSNACIGFCDFVDGEECKTEFAQNGAFGMFLSILKNPAPHPERGLNFHKIGWLDGSLSGKSGSSSMKGSNSAWFHAWTRWVRAPSPGPWVLNHWNTAGYACNWQTTISTGCSCARLGVPSFKSQARQTLHAYHTYECLQQSGSQVVHSIVVG